MKNIILNKKTRFCSFYFLLQSPDRYFFNANGESERKNRRCVTSIIINLR
jgi:hypothetical protein